MPRYALSRGHMPHGQGIFIGSGSPVAICTRLKNAGQMNCYKHLKNAEKELTVSRENNFPYHTTAPIEREMREINRRVDIGVRWSKQGVENLLKVKMHKRLNNNP